MATRDDQSSLVWDLRSLAGMQLGRLAGWLVGVRRIPEPERLERMTAALGTITTLLPADHPACRIAVDALAATERRG